MGINQPTFKKMSIKKIPITELFAKRMMSKATLYMHVKAGKLNLYKLGGRSYIDADELDAAFTKVELKTIAD